MSRAVTFWSVWSSVRRWSPSLFSDPLLICFCCFSWFVFLMCDWFLINSIDWLIDSLLIRSPGSSSSLHQISSSAVRIFSSPHNASLSTLSHFFRKYFVFLFNTPFLTNPQKTALFSVSTPKYRSTLAPSAGFFNNKILFCSSLFSLTPPSSPLHPPSFPLHLPPLLFLPFFCTLPTHSPLPPFTSYIPKYFIWLIFETRFFNHIRCFWITFVNFYSSVIN